MLGKKRKESQAQPEVPSPQPAPTTAGAPKISVRKEWRVGPYVVVSLDGTVTIKPKDAYLSALSSLSFSKEYAAALADALLQAS